MKYQLTISTDDLAELESLLSGKAAEPAKTGKKMKPKPEPEPEDEDDLLGGEDDGEVTFEQLQEKVSEKAQAGLRDKIKKLLTKLGATKLSDLDEDKFQDFSDALDKLK